MPSGIGRSCRAMQAKKSCRSRRRDCVHLSPTAFNSNRSSAVVTFARLNLTVRCPRRITGIFRLRTSSSTLLVEGRLSAARSSSLVIRCRSVIAGRNNGQTRDRRSTGRAGLVLHHRDHGKSATGLMRKQRARQGCFNEAQNPEHQNFPGIRRVMYRPLGAASVAWIAPPHVSMLRRAIARPRPVPPVVRWRAASGR